MAAEREADSGEPIIRRVAVIGAGTMGQGIAQVFAATGHVVTLIDVSLDGAERGVSNVRAQLDRAVDRGRLDPTGRDDAMSRLAPSGSVDAAAGADLVVEAVFEDLAAKREIFERVGRSMRPDAILTSNTSSISITQLASFSGAPDRVAGFHFFNPVPVLPLVEIVRGLETADATVARLQAVATTLGKTGVVVRDSPGFVVNRLLIPMINEAATLLEQGIASRDDIDAMMRLGASHPMGPLALADLIGLDVCLGIMETLHRDLGEDRYRPATLLRLKVLAGHLGRKTGKGFHDHAAD